MGDTETSRRYRLMDIVIPIIAAALFSLLGIVWASTSGQIHDLEKKSDAMAKETSELKAHREDDFKTLEMILGELRYIRAKVDAIK